MNEEWMPLTEAVKRLNVQHSSLLRRIKTGTLRAQRVAGIVEGEVWSRRWYVDAAQVLAEEERRRIDGPAHSPRPHAQLAGSPLLEKDQMSIQEARHLLGISDRSLYERIRVGTIPACQTDSLDGLGRLRRRWFVSRAAVEADCARRHRTSVPLVEAAYFAGLIDGEGTLGIQRVPGASAT